MNTIPTSELRYPPCLRVPDLGGRTRTRSRGTLAAYRVRYHRIHRAACAFYGRDNFDLIELAEYVRQRAAELRHSSYRQYVASILQFMRDALGNGIISVETVEQAVEILRIERSPENAAPYLPANAPARTSARRSRKVSEYSLAKAISKSLERQTSTRFVLAGILKFGALIGLRPTEWFGASLEGRKLFIRTAKFSEENGRGIARVRDIDLEAEQFEEADLQLLKSTLDQLKTLVTKANGRVWIVYRRLARLLRELRKGTGNAALSLRTLRHQTRSNLVGAGYSSVEVAAILGHACEETAEVHYGDERSGWGLGMFVTPNPDLVSRVRPGASKGSKIRLGHPATWTEYDSSRRDFPPTFTGPLP